MYLNIFVFYSADSLLDLAVHTKQGFVTAAHKLVLLTNFKILQEFPNTDCLILPDFSEDTIKNSFHNSFRLHSQVILLSGANINLTHSSVTLGPDQHAKVKFLQDILGSQTTPMGDM